MPHELLLIRLAPIPFQPHPAFLSSTAPSSFAGCLFLMDRCPGEFTCKPRGRTSCDRGGCGASGIFVVSLHGSARCFPPSGECPPEQN